MPYPDFRGGLRVLNVQNSLINYTFNFERGWSPVHLRAEALLKVSAQGI